MPNSWHSDTKDGYTLHSLHGILQTSSKLIALLWLRIAKFLPFRYQRWPCTRQPSKNSSNNIFQWIFLLEQNIDWSLQGEMETQNCLYNFFQITRYQRWPSTIKPSWNSPNNILLQTILPHEQKLDWMGLAKKRLRNASFFQLGYKRWL